MTREEAVFLNFFKNVSEKAVWRELKRLEYKL